MSSSVPTLAHPQRPLPVSMLIALPDRDAVVRAAALVGVPGRRLPLTVHHEAPAEALAVTRAVAELLLVRLGALYPVCASCAGTGQDLDCARELGVLEERLASVASRAGIALAWTLARSSAP